MHLNEGQDRQFAQHYVTEQAIYVRARNPANVILVQNILQNLFNIIREINVFVAPFKPLREVELHEEEEIQNEQCSRFIVSISFNSDRNGDRRRYNLPAVNDIALIFQNPDGELPFHRDFKVYPRNDETLLINLNRLF